jgi:hypothetical protein
LYFSIEGPSRAWQMHVSWYERVVAPYHTAGAQSFIGNPYRSTNQSLTAAVYRFLTPVQAGKSDDTRHVNVVSLSAQTAGRITLALRAPIAFGLLALWLFCRRRDESAAEFAAVFVTVPLGILLLSEISLGTHHVNLIIPCAVILVRAACLRDERAQRLLWAVAAALLVCIIGAQRTVHLLSPFLLTTLLLLYATAALALSDFRIRRAAAAQAEREGAG